MIQKIRFRGRLLEVKVTKEKVEILNYSEESVTLFLHDKVMTVASKKEALISLNLA